jgi:phosphohistidine phosphatase
MLFGHNPGFTDLVLYLTGHDVGNMPTAGIARIDLAVDSWRGTARDLGGLAWFDFPKKHR